MEDKLQVFVTVGTTKFEKLIETALSEDITNILKKKGVNGMVLQIGKGELEPTNSERTGFSTEMYRYKATILEDIENADFVISHAGAGSCLEVLGAGKPLIVVINDDLMDNHQLELAQKLHQLGHVYYTTCRDLAATLETMDLASLQPLEKGKPEKLAAFIDKVVGLS